MTCFIDVGRENRESIGSYFTGSHHYPRILTGTFKKRLSKEQGHFQ